MAERIINLPELPDRPEPVVTPDLAAAIAKQQTPDETAPHISFSQLSTFLRCSFQYKFAYIDKLKQKPNLPMAVGSGGHAALEYNTKHKIKTGFDFPSNDLIDIASDFIDSETKELKDSTKGEAKDRALAGIRIFRERDAPGLKPAGAEVQFLIDLNDPEEENVEPIRLVKGFIDYIGSDFAVDDYKFANKMKSQPEVDLSPQLTLYSKAMQLITGKPATQVGLRVFTPGNTKAQPEVRHIVRSREMMTPEAQNKRFMRLRFMFQQVERAIRLGIFIPTDDPRTCSWCGYRDRCQASLVDDFTAAKIREET